MWFTQWTQALTVGCQEWAGTNISSSTLALVWFAHHVAGLHNGFTGSHVDLFCQCLLLAECHSLYASRSSGQLLINMLHIAPFVMNDCACQIVPDSSVRAAKRKLRHQQQCFSELLQIIRTLVLWYFISSLSSNSNRSLYMSMHSYFLKVLQVSHQVHQVPWL